MKKIYLLAALLVGFSTLSQAQNYIISNSTGTESDYEYTQAGNDVLPIGSTDVLSSWQTIPFSFDFFGSAVTGYYVSDNGYITFDNSATTSFNSNTSIPDAAGPNDAIYAFWDDVNVVAGAGSPDRVTSWTYGTAPYRVHVIQWFSVTPVSGSGFLYAAIRLYECGDFDVINSYGNAAGMTATIGAENATGTVAVEVPGSPNLSYPALDVPQDDDIVYTFLSTGVNYDIQVTSIDLSAFVTVGNNDVSGTLRNMGASTINSFDLHYTIDAGSPVTQNVTGVNIAPGATYAFSHTSDWNVGTGGQTFDLCVYADNINSNSDERPCNDVLCASLFSNTGVSGTKRVLLEEFTGAWCGWCPDGAVVMEEILNDNPGSVFAVSIHDGDDMEFSEGIRTEFGVTAYPNGMVDRWVFDGEPDEPHSRGTWSSNASERMMGYTPVDVDLTQSWDTSTREITVVAQADFVDYSSGDLRFILYITEDSVTGTGSGYDQINYLNATPGHPFFGAGDPIIGYVHRHVLRAMPGGAMGNAGVIPSTTAPSSTYSETFTYTLPSTFDETKVDLIVAVAFYSTNIGERYISNVYGEHLQLSPPPPVGIAEGVIQAELKIFPNPNSGKSVVELNFLQPDQAVVTVYDAFGNRVAELVDRSFPAGKTSLDLDLSEVSNGFYFVKVESGQGSLTKKISVLH